MLAVICVCYLYFDGLPLSFVSSAEGRKWILFSLSAALPAAAFTPRIARKSCWCMMGNAPPFLSVLASS